MLYGSASTMWNEGRGIITGAVSFTPTLELYPSLG